MRAILSDVQLREAMDRLLEGDKLSYIAERLNIDRSALNHRLKRRFPDEYETASKAGIIKRGGARRNYDARTKEMFEAPEILAVLQEGVSIRQASITFNIPLSTLHQRVQRVKDLQRQLQSQHLEA